MERKIILNRIKTPDGTVLTSFHRHDYVSYQDKNGDIYMTDGGGDYLRRSVNKIPYEDLTVYSDAPFEVIRENLHRGSYGKNGDQPLSYTPLNKMSNNWIKNCITYNQERGLENSFPSQMYLKELEYRKENNIFIED